MPHTGLCQTNPATQENDRATATSLMLGSHLSQVTHIHCKFPYQIRKLPKFHQKAQAEAVSYWARALTGGIWL